MVNVASQQASKNAITLRGSAEIVTEFFVYMPRGGEPVTSSSLIGRYNVCMGVIELGFGINSILYQRGIYPPESFAAAQKYGLTVWLCRDNEVTAYLDNILAQVKVWLEARVVQRLVLVISSVDSQEVLERWEFIVENEASSTASNNNNQDNTASDKTSVADKDVKQVRREVQNVIRQITASVTFLPLLDCACSFNLLIHTCRDAEVPATWNDSAPCFIANSEQVRLRSFSTRIHKVDTVVSYKCDA